MSLPNINDLVEGRNLQIDNREVHEALGEVNVTRRGQQLDIVATILLNPQDEAEGWQTGVAVDASYSMSLVYGGKQAYIIRPFTAEEEEKYKNLGLLKCTCQDGKEIQSILPEGIEIMENDKVLKVKDAPNEVESVCRKIIPMLAGQLDADGGTTVIQWALGPDGSGIKVLGDYTEQEAALAAYPPPDAQDWGHGTRLMPAINYFMETFKDAPMGFYIFITDGHLDDFEEVKQFTIRLSHDIDEKKVNPVKLVLIGVGNEIDEQQLEDLDDLPDTHDLPVDVWDHKIAKEMRSLMDIFTEMVDENKIVAPSAEIQDDSGKSIHHYTDGLPAMLRFTLPATARGFRIMLPNGTCIGQRILA